MSTIKNPFAVKTKSAAEQLAAEIIGHSSAVAPFLVTTHQTIYNKLWKESFARGTSPQEVLNAMGSDAAKLFEQGGKLVEFLLTKDLASMTESEYTPKQTPVFNQDGTVTLL